MHKTRTIVWQALAWQSTVVHIHKINVDNGSYGRGFAVGKTDGNIPFAMEYEITLTENWDIKETSIKSLLDERAIRLVHEDKQWYNEKGQHLVEFDGIEFVDISISPFTNTLPIKRLRFNGKNAQKVDVIYFDENRFSLRKMQQIYSQVDERTYCYQDIELPDFVSNIVVDNDGMVIDFLKLFIRI